MGVAPDWVSFSLLHQIKAAANDLAKLHVDN